MSTVTTRAPEAPETFTLSATGLTEWYAALLKEQRRVEGMRLKLFLQQIEDSRKEFLDHPEAIATHSLRMEKEWLTDHVYKHQEFLKKEPILVHGELVLAVTPAECLELFSFEEQPQLAKIIARALVTRTAYENLDATEPDGGKLFPILAIWARNVWDDKSEQAAKDDY